MKHFKQEWIEEWCTAHGWTDLFVERQGNYWAFPPGAVMPQPIPVNVLRSIKAMKGFSPMEQKLVYASMVLSLGAIVLSWLWQSPVPLAIAFASCAVIAATLEPEYVY